MTSLRPDEPAFQERVMHGPEVRRRAVAGAAVFTVRSAAIRVVGFAGTIVLARLLAPHDFGLLAFGSTLMVFAKYLLDGGLGAAWIATARMLTGRMPHIPAQFSSLWPSLMIRLTLARA
jgi:hypothetical protein